MVDYDKLASEYARHRRLHPGVLRDLLSTGQITDRSAVCEFGCGTGNYITAIRSATGCACIGLDPSDEMLSHARRQTEHVQWHLGKAEQLSIGRASVDLVFSVDVIHHVTGRLSYFQEAFQVLRSGGRLCTVTDSEAIIRERPLSRYFPETVPVELQRYPAMHDLHALMETTGFTDIVETVVEHEVESPDIQPYRDKAFSALHLISDAAFQRGIDRMERDLQAGSLRLVLRYVLLWGTKPATA